MATVKSDKKDVNGDANLPNNDDDVIDEKDETDQPSTPNNDDQDEKNNKTPKKPSTFWLVWKEPIFWGQSPWLLLGSGAMLVSSYCNQSLPRLMGKLIDHMATTTTSGGSSSTDSLTRMTLQSKASSSLQTQLAMVVLGGGLASWLRTVLLNQTQGRIASQLREYAMAQLLTQRTAQWFQQQTITTTTTTKDKYDTKEKDKTTPTKDKSKEKSTTTTTTLTRAAVLGTILDQDVEQLANLYTNTMTSLLRGASAMTYSTIQMLRLDATLLAYSAAIIPLVGLTAVLLRKPMKRLDAQARAYQLQAAAFTAERLQHYALLELSQRQADELTAYRALQRQAQTTATARAHWQGGYMGFLFAASSASLLFVVQQGNVAIQKGKLTSGQLTSFATFSFLLGLGTSGLVKASQECHAALAAAERFYQEFGPEEQDDKPPTSQATDTTRTTNATTTTTAAVDVDINDVTGVRLTGVSFAYEQQQENETQLTQKMVLQDISMELTRGKVVALVGHNGSGKSTLASIAAGLYQPTSGSVDLILNTQQQQQNGSSSSSVNGNSASTAISMQQLAPQQRTRWVHLLSQTTALFDTTILDNVRYTRPDATREQVDAALRQANCTSFVQTLGLDYRVGYNGNLLSGGQRQRLALARALLADPSLLILDEPTTSLDQEGQMAIDQVLQTVQQSATATMNNGSSSNSNGSSATAQQQKRAVLLIVHHSKSLALADTILVMKGGQIVERGTLKELTRKGCNSELLRLMPDSEQ